MKINQRPLLEGLRHGCFVAVRFTRGFFDRLDFISRLHPISLIAFIISASSAIYTYIDFDIVSCIFTVAAFVVGLFAVSDTLKNFGKAHRVQLDDLYQQTISKLVDAHKGTPNLVFMSDRAEADHAVYDRHTIPLIDHATNQIEIVAKPFELSDTLKKYACILLRGTSFDTTNDSKLKLCTDVNEVSLSTGDRIRLQKTSYFNDRVTNGMAKSGVQVDADLPIVGPQLMLATGVGGPSLAPLLDDSPLSNQLGGSTLLITADRKLVYLQQGDGTQENRGRYAPTGSGSFDWNVLNNKLKTSPNLTFTEFVRSEIERELREEAGVKEKYALKTILVGFARFLYRNGKPEIFAISFTNMRYTSLSIRVSEWRYIMKKLHCVNLPKLDAPSVIDGMNDLKNKLFLPPGTNGITSGSASLPLLLNLQIGSEYLADCVDRLKIDPVANFFEKRVS